MTRLLLLLFAATQLSRAATYYVSAAGNDSNAGTSTGAAWLTVGKVNSTATTGDIVYFRRGDRWREQITIPASTMTFGAYGAGAAPIIDGANTKTWTNTSGNIWTASVTDDPFFIMFNGTTGTKAANAGAVDAANEWFWTGGTLTVYNVGDPAAVVTVPTREYGIVSQVGGSPRNTITIRDLEFRGARYYNLKNSSGNTWLVENVVADHSGHGGMVFEVVNTITVRYSRVSYANQLGPTAFHEAITFQGGDGFTITGNTLYNNGEDGITAKYNARNGTIAENVVYNGGTGPSIYVDSANNIVVRGNYVYNSLVNDKAGIGLAIEFGANPSNYNLHTITVVGNVVTGHATGVWIWIEDGAEAFADINNIKIHNNTLTGNNKTNWGGIFVYGAGTAADYGAGNEIRNNIIYNNVGTQIWDIVSGGVVASEFSVTNNLFKTGDTVGVLGTNSVTTSDVLFTGLGQGVQVYDLASGSPARNVGAAISGTAHVAQEHAADIGAREYFPPAVATGTGGCFITGVSNASPPRLTCSTDPGWSSGQRIRVVNLVTGTNTTSAANGDRYVTKITGTTYDLYSDSARTIPLAAPGVHLAHGAIMWARPVAEHTFDISRPRLYRKEFIENLRREVSRGTLTNIVVSGGTATANFANTGTIPHIFKVGGGVGVWGSATSALNTESATVSAVTSTTITWTTAAANGTYTDAAVSAYAHTGNIGWVGIKAACTAFTEFDQPGNNSSYPNKYHSCALVYYIDRSNTTARDRALWILDNAVSQIAYGSTHCKENGAAYCEDRDNGVDYSRGFMAVLMRTYDVLKATGAVSIGTDANFKAQILTDKTTDPGCVNDPFTVTTGSVSFSGSTLTGVGTNFTSFAVGGLIWLLPDTTAAYGVQLRFEEDIYRITAIASDTSLTLDRAPFFSAGQGFFFSNPNPATSARGTGWTYFRPWRLGDCGLKWLGRHHNIHIVSNPAIYPPNSNLYGGEWNPHNLGLTGAYGEVSIGVGLYGEDPRADATLLDNWAILKDHHIATSIGTNGDAMQMGGNYGYGRGLYAPAIATWINRSFPTLASMSGYWQGGYTRLVPYAYNGALGSTETAQFTQTGDGASSKTGDIMAEVGELVPYTSETEQRAWQATLARYCGVANAAAVPYTCFSYGGGSKLDHLFVGWNPQLVPNPLTLSSLPKAKTNRTSSASICEGTYCYPTLGVMGESISRWNWSQTPIKNLHVGYGPTFNDHHTPIDGHWWLRLGIQANPTFGVYPFIGADNYSAGTATYTQDNNSYLVLSAHNRITQGGSSPVTYSGETDDVYWISVDTKGAFITPPTRAHRRFVRFTATGGQDIIIVDSDVAASAGTIRELVHFTPNGQAGEGSTTCAGSACTANTSLTANLHSENTDFRVMQNTVFPDGGGVRRIDLTNGGYSGGTGNTFRLVMCASADGTTCNASATTLRAISAYHIGAIADGTSMTTTSRSVGSWRGITAVANGDTVNTMFASTAQTSMGAITLPAGKLFVLGLAAGAYDVKVDGAVVANAVTVTAEGGAIYVGSQSAGSVEVVPDGGNSWYVSPSVTNTSGNGTIGNPCGLAAVLEGNCSTSPAIAAGDTIYLRAGVHLIGRYGAGLTTWRETSLAGTSGNPITFRSYPGEWARVDGGIIFNGSDIIWRDTEVFCSLTDKQSAENGSFPTDMYCPAALSAKAARIKFINNVVRNSGEIALWDTAPNSEAYGNINYYGGWRSLGGTGHGHGFYIQNNTGQHRVEANIVHNTFGQGVQVYGTSVSNLNNVFFDNNVWMRGGFANNNSGTPVPTRNFLIGGAVNAADMTIRHNHSFEGEVNLGYNGGSGQGCSNMEYSNSYSVTPNTIAYALNIADGIGGDLACNFNGSTTGNTRYGDPNGATLPGTNRILTAGTLPSTAEVSVVPNIYETGRANIIVWNWPAASSVTVDVSSIGLTSGDTFAVKDSQNYFGTPARVGTYTGSSISVPMNLTMVETPIWTDPTPAITHTSSQFNAFVIVKTGTSTVNITTTTLPSGTQGSAYSQTLAADNCSPCVWSLASGSLPSGLTLASDGTISGTPSVSGSFSITPQATIAATGALDITPPTISLTISAPSGGSGVSSTVRGVAIRGGTIR